MSYSEERGPNKTLIQTYVFYSNETKEDKAFYVSTIDRESSSMYGGRYAETIVWEWDSSERKRGSILHMESGIQGTIRIHQNVCAELYKHGKILTDEDEENV
jgi:hypothetical protein